MLFIGRYDHTIDNKGRLAVPSRWRDTLVGMQEERLVLTKYRVGPHRCLHGYPLSNWVLVKERFDVQPLLDPQMAALRRAYLSHGQECPIDPQGRVLLPPHLREYAKLDRDVRFVGDGGRIEIWDRSVCDRIDRDDDAAFDDSELLRRLA